MSLPAGSVPWLFLFVTAAGSVFTWNAYFPRRHQSLFVVPSFFAGWLTSELVAHHFAWQLAATVLFVWLGALEAWPGWVGLGLTVASWAAMLALVPVAGRSRDVVEGALREALGPDYGARVAADTSAWTRPDRRRSRLVVPFLLRDPAVRVVRDVRYAEGAGRRHLLDVYAPREGPTAPGAPVLLQVHGGAWVVGDKRQQALPLMLHLAARGWVCVAANYRLSPRTTFPDHLIDLKLALRWIRAHAAEYGGDPGFVAVTGGSAGGHLSALLALTPNDPRFQPGFEDVDTRLRACVPFYGLYDLANRFDHPHWRGLERFWSRLVLKRRFAEDPQAYRDASPAEHARADAPPFFVIHGTHDSLAPVAEARAFVAHLGAVSRSPVAYAEVPGAQHAFEIFHSLRTRHVVEGVARFLAWVHAGRVPAAVVAPTPRRLAGP